MEDVVFEIYRSTVVSRGLRPLPASLGLGLAGLMAFLSYGERPRHLPADLLSIVYTIVVTSGLIGMDVLNGSTHLLLTRPITRNGYLAGRFLGALTVSGGACLLMYATATVAVALRGDGAEGVRVFGAQALGALAGVIWTSSVMLFFSTMLPERGDVLGYLGTMVTAFSVVGIARLLSHAAFVAAAQQVSENLMNVLAVSDLATHPALLSDVLRWSSNTALVLAGAAVAFHHREFSYAAG
jgi:ABC-type transport system involved in multi-copper enzyme maturation permease subunit